MRKYLIGWLRFRPGTRAGFLAAARPFIDATRKEEGSIFFEMLPSPADADAVVVIECFTSEAAHALHEASPHMAALRKEMDRLVVDAYFEQIFAEPSVTSGAMFAPVS